MESAPQVKLVIDEASFTWDEAKTKVNQAKHGVHFEEAATVLLDPLAVDEEQDGPAGERRTRTTGWSQFPRILLVVHTERGATTRLISARRATAAERRAYEFRAR